MYYSTTRPPSSPYYSGNKSHFSSFTAWLKHHSQQWNGDFFTRKSLFDLGVSYQLGHGVYGSCPLPSTPVDLTLFDISGVHTVRIKYCYCNNGGSRPSLSRRVQLLRIRWFPASWSIPGTVFTFRLLDFTHKLQTRSKVNLYDFHASLVSLTNSAGLVPPIVRFFTMFHLLALIRGLGSLDTANCLWS